MHLGIEGKQALVTGASKGLGFAAAKALAAEGVTVYIASRDRKRIESAAAELEAAGGKVVAHTADLSNRESLQSLIAELGAVDILVSNTGGPPSGELDSFSPEDWRAQYEAIFESALLLSSGLSPGMRSRGWGRIIYITSVSVLTPLPRLGISNALRAGIAGLAKSQAIEWGREGVTVNCIAPGLFATDRLKELSRPKAEAEGVSIKEILDRKGEGVPSGRVGDPDELGSLAAYLASAQAGYINGLVMPIDGGKHL